MTCPVKFIISLPILGSWRLRIYQIRGNVITIQLKFSDFIQFLWFWRKLDSSQNHFLTASIQFWNVLNVCRCSNPKFSDKIRPTETQYIQNECKFNGDFAEPFQLEVVAMYITEIIGFNSDRFFMNHPLYQKLRRGQINDPSLRQHYSLSLLSTIP